MRSVDLQQLYQNGRSLYEMHKQEPRKRYGIRLSYEAYTAAERDSLSSESHRSHRANIFFNLLDLNKKEGLTRRQYKWLKAQQGYYRYREIEFKSVGGYDYDND